MTFRSGQSGNPNGPPRRPHPRTQRVRKLIRDKTGAIVEETLKRAEAGDPHSLQMFFKYLMPRCRFVAEPVDLPPVQNAVGAREQIGRLVSMAAGGLLDLDSLNILSRALAMAIDARATELETLAEEMDLEGDHGG